MSGRAKAVGIVYLLAGVWNVGGAIQLARDHGAALRQQLPPSAWAVVGLVGAAFLIGIASTIGGAAFLLRREWGRRTLVAVTWVVLVSGALASFAVSAYAVATGAWFVALPELAGGAVWVALFAAGLRVLRDA